MDNHNHHHPKPQQQQQQEKQPDKYQQQQQQEKDHQQQQKHEEQVAETEQKRPTVSQSPLTKKTTHSPPPDPSPVDSPLSSDSSSLSHGFSQPPTTTTQPNSKPPSAAVSRAELTSRDQSTATTIPTVELEEQTQKLGSGSGKRLRPDLSILRRTKRDKMIKKALLGFRISAFVFSLVSFSVLAADKDQGWALDSFYRYKEFRFCLAVNVIGFVYSGIQACDLAYQLTSGKQKPRSQLRSYLDFVLDQILAYLLISASSSATVRVDDWQSNWGNDKFPQMARASMALSLVAFVALALSSVVSGYNLCTLKSM